MTLHAHTLDQADGLRTLMGRHVGRHAAQGPLGLRLVPVPAGGRFAPEEAIRAAVARLGLDIQLSPPGADPSALEVLAWVGDSPSEMAAAAVELSALGASHAWLLMASNHRDRGRAAALEFSERIAVANPMEIRFLGVAPRWSDRRTALAIDRALTRLHARWVEGGGCV